MTFWEADKRTKPDPWSFEKGLVDPKWDWFHKHAIFTVPMLANEGTGQDAFREEITGLRTQSMQATAKYNRRGWGYTMAVNQRCDWAASSSWAIVGDIEFTMFVALNKTGTQGAAPAFLAHRTAADATAGYWIISGTASPGVVKFEWHNGTSVVNVTFSGATFPADGEVQLALTRKLGGVYDLYINGFFADTQTLIGDLSAGDKEIHIGQQLTSGERAVLGDYYCCYILKGVAANQVQITALVADPFGPFRMDDEDELRLLAVAVAGGANPKGPLGHPLWGPLAGPVGV